MSQAFQDFQSGGFAYDPTVRPDRYEGVRSRRVFAFLIDAAVVLFLMLVASLLIGALGIFTLGLGWFLFPLIWPVVPIVYSVLTVGGRHSATPGMRFAHIELRTTAGESMTPLLALLHALGFWFTVTLLTPFVLVVALLNARKQLLHDLALGTVAVRSRD